jgi:arylsulfatase A-like enzyme/tetratricopeptide (TPR) repeat protein
LDRERIQRLWAAQGESKPNVILITLDTIRADHLGCYGDPDAGTPNLDALARAGVLFAQATSPAALTLPAHSSIMTGMYPPHHGVRVNGNAAVSEAQTTLAEALSAEGYKTAAFVGAFVLDGRWGLNQGFQAYDDRFDLKKYAHLDLGGIQRRGDEVMDAALAWLDGHKQDAFFAWIHLYDAHTPYEPPEPFLSTYGPRGAFGLYDGEIAFADAQVGRCVSWLHANGMDRKTVIVVMGDHGESLGSHGEATHGYFAYDATLHVPLLIVTPFRELSRVRVDSQVSSVDVFPTVLGLAGVDLREPVHGRSLIPAMFHPRADADAYAYAESMTPSLQFGWSPLECLRTTRYKLIKAPRPELYDLAADPGEATNVYDRHPEVARALTRELDRLVRESTHGAPAPEAADLDRETVERLAALGYVGAAVAPQPAVPSGSLADPKDKLPIFAAVQQAGELIVQDQYPAAADLLESALRDDPRMPQARLMLGGAYSELNRTPEAKAQFDLVLKDDPRNVQALMGVANLLMREGKGEDVIALCQRTLSLDERSVQAHALLGEAYADRKEPARALPYFEKAVEIQPKLTQNRLNLAGALIEVREYGRAKAMLDEILADSPRFPLAQFNLGLLYEGQDRIDEARSAYLAEVSAHPQQFRARFNLGKILFRVGDRAGALEQMREVIRIAPRQPEGYLFVARGLLLQGSTSLEEVQSLAEKGLSLAKAPDIEALGWLLLADVYNRKRQPAKMNEALRRADALTSAGRSRSRDAKAN